MVLLTAEQVAGEITKEVEELKKMQEYIQENIPVLIAFGIKVVLAIVVFCVGRIVIKWVRKLVRASFERSNADKGVAQFVDSVLKTGLYILLIFLIATRFGVESSSVAALIASAGVAVGLALQGSLSNLAGGVLILLLKPFVVGDYIIEDNHKNEGVVSEIQIFYTKLTTGDNQTIVIPNGALANSSLVNVSAQTERRIDLTVGISYQADLKAAKKLIEGVLNADESVQKDKELAVYVDQLGESAVIIGVRAWVKSEEYLNTKWRMLENIKLALDQGGIEIPYPNLTVHVAESAKENFERK